MDFRLIVFISVARNRSFTKAANELHISQPAVTRHIHELESEYNTRFFERTGNRIELTNTGEIFLQRAEEIINKYKSLQLEMNLLTGSFSGELQVGASSTIGQYVLPPLLAAFIKQYPDIKLSVFTGNTEQIEQALEEHRIDIGLIEGNHRKPTLKYLHFRKDELVLVASVNNTIHDEISLNELCLLPLVLREPGSGTLEVIERALIEHKIKLPQMNILLQLGSTESIKRFVAGSPAACAIVSVASVLDELVGNILKVVDIKGLEFTREFAFVLTQGQHSEIQERFMQFLTYQS